MSQIALTPALAGANEAASLINGILNVAKRAKNSIANGAAATQQGNFPACTGADVTSALSESNLAIVQAVIAAAGV